ncbi:hypothetical protein [Ktedonobacter robiniae]|nr:hypothetical protein [Ktedonobacter robiniae]
MPSSGGNNHPFNCTDSASFNSGIYNLVGTIQREQAAIGVFITLEEPSRDMVMEALKASFYHSPGWNKDYPRIQIVTIEELLHQAEVKMPPQFGTFKQAQRERQQPYAQQGDSTEMQQVSIVRNTLAAKMIPETCMSIRNHLVFKLAQLQAHSLPPHGPPSGAVRD